MLRIYYIVGIGLFLGACVKGRSGTFIDAPVVTRVDDSRSIQEPVERIYYSKFDIADTSIFLPMINAPLPRSEKAALDVNAMDEVPDSTWFQNRISTRALTPSEVSLGGDLDGGPQSPFTIVSAKKGGANPGFIMKDAKGVTYIVKFDTAENPEQQTGNNVIVNRLFSALGYHVPNDYIFHFQPKEMSLSEKVIKKGVTPGDVEKMIAAASLRADGAVRATASQFLSGIPKGGFSPSGTRDDDTNDIVAHQHRRSLRALKVFGAWLGHTDIKENNTLDMYIDEDGRRFLRHYLVDFGEALGGHQSEKDQPQVGFEYLFDWAAQGRALISFGLWVRPWERQVETPWKAVGYFGAKHFKPKEWKARYPYEPFYFLDAADAFWAAKQVMKFDRPAIEAVVRAAQFSDARASSYLVETLLRRRDKVGRAYLDGVTPLDEFTVEEGKLCATDLMRKYNFASESTLVISDSGTVRHTVMPTSRVCVAVPKDETYRMWRLRIQRGGKQGPTMEIHLRGGSTPRILGIVH